MSAHPPTLTMILAIFFLVARSTIGKEANTQTLHHLMTKREIQQYFGVDSHEDVPEYDVTEPYQSTAQGDFLSYNLHNKHKTKRSVDYQHDQHYTIRAFGRKLHLNLRENKDLIAPGLKLETYKDGKVVRSEIPRSVHYTGRVSDDPQSIVAITHHEGLTGMIKVRDDALFLRPLPNHLANRAPGKRHARPHLVYRRSVKSTGLTCDTKDDESDHEVVERSVEQSKDQNDGDGAVEHKYLELGLVTDEQVKAIHGADTSTYLLQLGNILNSMFQDKSIGSKKITVVVNQLAIITNTQLGAEPGASKSTKLSALSQWATTNNVNPPSDADPMHVDALSLVARGGIGGGLAASRVMCERDIVASMANDIGLQTAIILAHELAHNIGVGHDGGSPNCPSGVNIMSPATPSGVGGFKWSQCSETYIQKFLTESRSSCLNDKPPASRPILQQKYRDKLPGQLYDGDTQCRYQYGSEYSQCTRNMAQCLSLYCTNTRSLTCSSNLAPPMDGTACGPRQWCIKGVCVDNGLPAINGGWTEWSTSYQQCTTKCNGGVQYKTRTCTNPKPENGGDNCEGSSNGQWRICNPEACPADTQPFRRTQCKAKDPTYTEYYRTSSPCALMCTANNLLYSFGKVTDGTRCHADPTNRDVCIEGQCRSVGCDTVLESGSTLDRCGVCNGVGSTCELIKKVYIKDWRSWGPSNADTLETLPVGSSRVNITKRAVSYNLLGIQNHEGEYLIRVPSWTATVFAAGSKIRYLHEDDRYKDQLFIDGPTTETLLVKFVYIYEKNGGVEITYFKPAVTGPSNVKFEWKTSSWSPCSESCAGGERTRWITCIRSDDKTPASDSACGASVKPVAKESCNLMACPVEWHVAPWTICSKLCGKGSQSRSIVCRQKTNSTHYETLSHQTCIDKKLVKPNVKVFMYCNEIPCLPEWQPLAWSACSTSCGPGVVTRKLVCRRIDESGITVTLSEEMCRHALKIPTSEPCNQDKPCKATSTPVLETDPMGKMDAPAPPEIRIACFKYIASSNLASLADLTGEINWDDTTAIVQKCSQLAHNKGYKYFALGNNGVCYSGPDTQTKYYKDGVAGKNDCHGGVGKSNSIFAYALDPLPSLTSLGCYRDKDDSRALPKLYANMRDQIEWKNTKWYTIVIAQCARIAFDMGYSYFGVQFYGECWSSTDDMEAGKYKQYGPANNCILGVGAHYSNVVYQINKKSSAKRKK